ncbi:hypothetical protein ASPZODRAFT_23883 [Penicilliopsis zonata CBS 506.65]|uniref:Uncharacterized protein n=1 Tax=Penicilliopsis zonata CBS 506.65 TaxID=1073090 RepID=A0A1L9SLV6_9EURO|nr:hypothetical protein ASPZODRAFT_23883 [Penicilliopsis zonata CBS 506.65]OJJ48229.1 hypothetical protein ASPZODRAFT_23883 [Penicilliopsis zonata CBS 506.65]
MSDKLKCSAAFPTVPSYPDISGIGVVLGYAITGFLVVGVLTVYYIFAFRPELDPFRKEDKPSESEEETPFRPNPIDNLICQSLEKIRIRASKSKGINQRLETALAKFVLSMSDLQIMNGLSILITG